MEITHLFDFIYHLLQFFIRMRENELDNGISKPSRIRVKVIVSPSVDTLLNEADNPRVPMLEMDVVGQ